MALESKLGSNVFLPQCQAKTCYAARDDASWIFYPLNLFSCDLTVSATAMNSASSPAQPSVAGLGRYVLAGSRAPGAATGANAATASSKSVTAVVITYNSARWLENCLSSLARQRAALPGLEVVIADNNSSDGTPEAATRLAQALQLPLAVLTMGGNRGYAVACNAGIRHGLARGADFILISNPDVEYDEDALLEMIGVALSTQRAGPVSPVHLSPDKLTVEPYCAWFMKFSPGLVSDCQHGRVVAASYRTEFVNGAVMLLSSEFIDRVGAFDEMFFFYCEDNDLCRRASLLGYAPLIATRARAVHWNATASGLDAFRRSAWRRATYTLILKKTGRPYGLSSLYALARFAIDLRDAGVERGELRRIVKDGKEVLDKWQDIRRSRLGDLARLRAHAGKGT